MEIALSSVECKLCLNCIYFRL